MSDDNEAWLETPDHLRDDGTDDGVDRDYDEAKEDGRLYRYIARYL